MTAPWEQIPLFDEETQFCDRCGGVEPNDYLLHLNHGHPENRHVYNGLCNLQESRRYKQQRKEQTA